MIEITVNVVIQQDDNWYVAKCLENDVASQGETVEESLANLKEALTLYYENTNDIKPKKILFTTMQIEIDMDPI